LIIQTSENKKRKFGMQIFESIRKLKALDRTDTTNQKTVRFNCLETKTGMLDANLRNYSQRARRELNGRKC
jgi:hypothetical protein